MVRENQHAWASLNPVITCTKILGLWPIETNNGYYRKSDRSTTTAIFYMIFTSITIIVYTDNATYLELVGTSLIPSYLNDIYFWSLFVGTFACHLAPQVCSKKIAQALRRTDEADALLRKMGMNFDLREIGRKTSKFGVAILASAAIGWLLELCLSIWKPYQGEKYAPPSMLLGYFWSNAIQAMAVTQYVTMTFGLERRLELLNQMIKATASKSRCGAPHFQNEDCLIAFVRNAGEVHTKLVKATRQINASYTFQLFIRINLHFMQLLGRCYLMIYIVAFSSDAGVVVNMVESTTMVLGELVLVVLHSWNLCYQVNL